MWTDQTGGRREKNQGEHAHQDQEDVQLRFRVFPESSVESLIRHIRRSRQHRHVICHP